MSNKKRRGSPIYHLRLDDIRRAKWQTAADREERSLSDFIKRTVDKKVAELQDFKGDAS